METGRKYPCWRMYFICLELNSWCFVLKTVCWTFKLCYLSIDSLHNVTVRDNLLQVTSGGPFPVLNSQEGYVDVGSYSKRKKHTLNIWVASFAFCDQYGLSLSSLWNYLWVIVQFTQAGLLTLSASKLWRRNYLAVMIHSV